MRFWGIEVKPGKLYPYYSDNVQGKLHITQATLGIGSSMEKSILQCYSGHKSPIFFCSLLPNKIESCPLNLEFDDEDLMAFLVIGPRSIHLSGYFVAGDGYDLRDDYELDSLGNDAGTDSTKEEESSEYDSEDGYGLPFFDDSDTDMYPSSPVPKSGDSCDSRKRKKKEENANASGNSNETNVTALGESHSEEVKATTNQDNVSHAEDGHDGKLSNNEVLVEKKSKKRKRKKTKESEGVAAANQNATKQVRTVPSGLGIEELSVGKPDGKSAASGKKVSVTYTGKLEKDGKIFDSTDGRRPFEFRLGVGEVIDGLEVGINGMRIGGKRRITIPPSMGYGDKRVGNIPRNSSLVFDVELVDVSH